MKKMSAWEHITIARSQHRMKALDLIPQLFDHFVELHGDRLYGDDRALVGGLACFEGRSITVLAQSKGRNLEENLSCNFGMLHPEGYRKAMRLAKQAEKFKRPIITIIDTAGAYPGQEAEERGQAEAIAQCLSLFAQIKVPVIALVLSEGGSGGALALSIANKIYMFENAVYSILSPEGFASILWKDEARAKEAAELMECTAFDLHAKGFIDRIIEEADQGLEHDPSFSIVQIKNAIRHDLNVLHKMKLHVMLEQRYQKFRSLGSEL